MANDDDPKRVCSRAYVFKAENHAYWKESMYVNLLSVDKNLCAFVTERHLSVRATMLLLNTPRICHMMKSKKTSYDLKTSNILISDLCMKVLY